MRQICLAEKDIYKGNLILVNEDHPLKEQQADMWLTPVAAHDPDILLERQAAKMLEKVKSVLGCGDEILAVSGYRTREEQEAIYAGSLQENGPAFTAKYVALPGCSEHQTGLAIDLGKNEGAIDFIRPDFPAHGICGQFRAMAVQYGFIERYPLHGEAITKIAHEPWHFRYVGYPHSVLISDAKVTLEEYTAEIQQHVQGKNHLFWNRGGQEVEIFYVPLDQGQKVTMDIPAHQAYQISGNNEGGAVVTLWRNRR